MNPICAILWCVTSASPTSTPSPVTTLTTPRGKPAWANRGGRSSIEADVNSEGLTTAVHPAASAGARCQLVRVSGEFQGVMIATTPLGSYLVYENTPFLSVGMTDPCTLSASPP